MQTIEAKSIFSRATGYIKRGGFEWTCNPYVGCTFGCNYCYAMFLPQNDQPKETWGKWVRAKVNAVELAGRHSGHLAGRALYLSSVTDPYLPLERSLGLTRGILEAISPMQPRLLVQTRSPLVSRDIDVFRTLHSIRVNISIQTDDESVRKVFEPKAPLLEERWEAAYRIKDAQIPVGICLTPLLPVEDLDRLVERLGDLRPDVIVAEDFHRRVSASGGDTGSKARELLAARRWSGEDYVRIVSEIRRKMPLHEGVAGFFPPP